MWKGVFTGKREIKGVVGVGELDEGVDVDLTVGVSDVQLRLQVDAGSKVDDVGDGVDVEHRVEVDDVNDDVEVYHGAEVEKIDDGVKSDAEMNVDNGVKVDQLDAWRDVDDCPQGNLGVVGSNGGFGGGQVGKGY